MNDETQPKNELLVAQAEYGFARAASDMCCGKGETPTDEMDEKEDKTLDAYLNTSSKTLLNIQDKIGLYLLRMASRMDEIDIEFLQAIQRDLRTCSKREVS